MSVCPFCKAPVQQTAAPCPRCGRASGDHPSIAAVQGRTLSTDFDDDDGAPALVLEHHRPSSGTTAAVPGAYDAGRSLDDDLFGDGGAAALELDMPTSRSSSGAIPVAASSAGSPSPSGPDLALAPSSSRRLAPASSSSDLLCPSGSHPLPGTSGTHPAARPSPEARDVRGDAAAPAATPVSSGSLPRAPGSDPRVDARAAPSGAQPVGGGTNAPPDPRTDAGALLVARYPPPPQKLWQAPVYACVVLYRQLELRRDLESLRRRRSPDVPLYEAALRAHDPRTYALGLTMTAIALALFLIAFFMPVIMRFARAPG